MINGWSPIDTAPLNKRILLAYSDGRVTIGKWDDDRFSKRPKPFWNMVDSFMGIRWMRDNSPIAWLGIPKYE